MRKVILLFVILFTVVSCRRSSDVRDTTYVLTYNNGDKDTLTVDRVIDVGLHQGDFSVRSGIHGKWDQWKKYASGVRNYDIISENVPNSKRK